MSISPVASEVFEFEVMKVWTIYSPHNNYDIVI